MALWREGHGQAKGKVLGRLQLLGEGQQLGPGIPTSLKGGGVAPTQGWENASGAPFRKGPSFRQVP